MREPGVGICSLVRFLFVCGLGGLMDVNIVFCLSWIQTMSGLVNVARVHRLFRIEAVSVTHASVYGITKDD